jgi:hypothetical protein
MKDAFSRDNVDEQPQLKRQRKNRSGSQTGEVSLFADSSANPGSNTREQHPCPATQHNSTATCRPTETEKRKSTSLPKPSARLAETSPNSSNSLIKRFERQFPNTSAAHLTESRGKWIYNQSEVGEHLGFFSDEIGLNTHISWTEGNIIAPHFQRLQELTPNSFLRWIAGILGQATRFLSPKKT